VIRHVETGEVFPQAAWVNSIVDAVNDIHAATVNQWEPLYRAEKAGADAAEAKLARVRALCDDASDCGERAVDTAALVLAIGWPPISGRVEP
jgi:hypothetical protein